jgi:hypothetical protein
VRSSVEDSQTLRRGVLTGRDRAVNRSGLPSTLLASPAKNSVRRNGRASFAAELPLGSRVSMRTCPQPRARA